MESGEERGFLEHRIAQVRRTLAEREAALEAQCQHHETWVETLERMAAALSDPEERETQARLIETVSERADTLRMRLDRMRREIALLEKFAPIALADPRAATGDLSRILTRYEASSSRPEKETLPVTVGLEAHDILPDPDLVRIREAARRGQRRR